MNRLSIVTLDDKNNCRPVVLTNELFLMEASDPVVVITRLNILQYQRPIVGHVEFCSIRYLYFSVVYFNDHLPNCCWRAALRRTEFPSEELQLDVWYFTFYFKVITDFTGDFRRNIVFRLIIYIYVPVVGIHWNRKHTISLQRFCLVHIAVDNYKIIRFFVFLFRKKKVFGHG